MRVLLEIFSTLSVYNSARLSTNTEIIDFASRRSAEEFVDSVKTTERIHEDLVINRKATLLPN